jgi:hypothetical protein
MPQDRLEEEHEKLHSMLFGSRGLLANTEQSTTTAIGCSFSPMKCESKSSSWTCQTASKRTNRTKHFRMVRAQLNFDGLKNLYFLIVIELEEIRNQVEIEYQSVFI